MVASFIPRRVRGIAGGTVVLLALGAASACGTQDGVPQSIGIFGSDTTQDVMAALATQYNGDNGYNPDVDTNFNVEAQVPAPDGGDTVNGDGVTTCGTKTYRTPTSVATEVTRPNGSTAGRDYLKVSVGNGDGCADIARSSAGPRPIGPGAGQDPASFEYYAFGIDAVGVTSASALAPDSLTIQQVRSIYNCTFTNWNQVGGGNGPIQRYFVQPQSGTRSFIISDLLGFDPATINTCDPVVAIQENDGSNIPVVDRPEAIFFFSVANWTAMSKGTITPDGRAGQEYFALDDASEGTITTPQLPVRAVGGGQFEPRFPTAGDPAPNAPIAESNVRLIDATPAYPGVRYVWNVIDNTTGANSYTPSKRFVGFDNQASPPIVSPLCNGDKAATLVNFGFGPLSKTADATHNIPGTACRLW